MSENAYSLMSMLNIDLDLAETLLLQNNNDLDQAVENYLNQDEVRAPLPTYVFIY